MSFLPELYFVCPNCGPYVRVFAEVLGEKAENPYAVELIEQGEHGLTVCDKLQLKPEKEEELSKIYHCGNCGYLVHSRILELDPVDQIEEYLHHIYRENESN